MLSRRFRRRIFYLLVGIFVLLGGGVVGFAEGWRIDFSTGHLEKVGAIYIRSYPSDASIFLDGKPVDNQSSFLSQGTLLSDLLPHTYTVTLEENGYLSWSETAAVSPSLVVPFKYAVLIPDHGAVMPSGTIGVISFKNSTQYEKIAEANRESSSTNPNDATQKFILKKNHLSIFNSDLATTTASTTLPGVILSALWASNTVIDILQTDGSLFRYDAEKNLTQKIADDVKSFSTTTDGATIAALEYKSLEIIDPSDATIYYRFNLPNISSARAVIWYKDNNHLFIVYQDHVAFLDFADTGLKNFTTIGKGTSPLYQPDLNTLFVLTPAGSVERYHFPQ